MRHLRADRLGERLGKLPVGLAAFAGASQGRHDVQSLAAGRLAERRQAQFLEPCAQFARRRDDRREFDPGARIQIEHQPSGNFGLARLAVPRVQLESG